jgi:biopolymer transport protein ExbB
MDALAASFSALWKEAADLWVAGGGGMLAIAIDALVMFALGCHVHLRLREKRFLGVSEDTLRAWVEDADARRGPVGGILDQATGARSLEDTALIFDGLRKAELAPFERDLKFMKICVGTAPLLGLFGTVTGMLATFGALATGSGGEQTMGLVAQGISEALITTETGLVVALPGLFFHYQLARKHDRYQAFLAHLETLCTQAQFRRQRRKRAEGAASAPRPLIGATS